MILSSKLSPLILLLAAMLIANACGGTTVTPNPNPAGTAAASGDVPGGSGEPAIPSDEPSSQPPSDEPSPTPSEPVDTPTSGQTATPTTGPTATAAPASTMIVRAYFLLAESGHDPTLVPVLRTVPESKATARAAMRALLAGPTTRELGASPRISTMIPLGTHLLGVTTASGVATVNLSGEFATATSSFAARARLAQVVYTLTQFSTIDAVRFELDGEPVSTFPPGITLDKPVSRATYRNSLLPDIFVDRPAWGAALLDGGRVNGWANVFEAQFRLAVLGARGRVLVDMPVHATCGSGCWGTFALTVSYTVSKAQWGTLRVWDPSERDGHPTSVREYPIWLVPS
jgi:germination protein M